jgi:translation elongation factor EF-Tu-like GTPase
MRSVTLTAPLVVHVSSISVGALHWTGDEGVTRKSVMWTVDAAPPFDPPPVVGVAAIEVVDRRGVAVVGLVDRGIVDRGTVERVEVVEVVGLDPTGCRVLLVVEDDEP